MSEEISFVVTRPLGETGYWDADGDWHPYGTPPAEPSEGAHLQPCKQPVVFSELEAERLKSENAVQYKNIESLQATAEKAEAALLEKQKQSDAFELAWKEELARVAALRSRPTELSEEDYRKYAEEIFKAAGMDDCAEEAEVRAVARFIKSHPLLARPSGTEGELREAEKLEIVADECHKQWSGWTGYLLGKMEPWGHNKEYFLMNKVWADRWRKQIATPYAGLSDSEKESDRREARKILAALSRPGGKKL